MNLILLFPDDFVEPGRVRLTGRRARHMMEVHRAAAGDELIVGLAGGLMGRGVVDRVGTDEVEMTVPALDVPPPPPLPLTLVLALPRPKVLNRVVAGATSLGIKRIYLVNAWRVEKSYWRSPRVAEENLLQQSLLGLEQARDTVLPRIELRRLFRPFVEEELPAVAAGSLALVAHPAAAAPVPVVRCPSSVRGAGTDDGQRMTDNAGRPVTLAIGPEGGFIEAEIASLERIGFQPVSLGERVLRVETAVAALVGRLF